MRSSRFCFVVLAIVLAVTPRAFAAETTANDVVSALHASLLKVMKDAGRLGFEGRRAYLAPVVAATFDIALIARSATGRHWKSLTEAERKSLIEKIGALTVASYAARFDGYSGEKFRVISDKPAPRHTMFVNTEIIKSNGEPVQINYLLRSTKSGWRIVDVYLKGIYSELALKRSEYTAVIKQRGVKGLLAAIDAKIADLANQAPD
ncbi:MAG: ABC transporter substrate-binding protein [Alphaproteobacteria bacterium]